MKIRILSVLLAVMLVLAMLTGCTTEPTTPENAPPTQETTESSVQAPAALPDLETLYNQGMDVLAQLGDDAPILFPETNIDYINEFYPGIADIELKQFYAGIAPVTNAPFEIILVEVAEPADVSTVIEIFQTRADTASSDTTYPENAEAWMNNCKITSRDNYVFLAVLMGSYEVPSEFILD